MAFQWNFAKCQEPWMTQDNNLHYENYCEARCRDRHWKNYVDRGLKGSQFRAQTPILSVPPSPCLRIDPRKCLARHQNCWGGSLWVVADGWRDDRDDGVEAASPIWTFCCRFHRRVWCVCLHARATSFPSRIPYSICCTSKFALHADGARGPTRYATSSKNT